MKLKDTFISHEVAGEQVLVDCTSSFSGLVRSNKTAAFIVDHLRSETTLDGIVSAMLEEYDVAEDGARRDAAAVIEKLREIGALDE